MGEEPVHVVWRHYQDWVLPPRAVRVILIVSLLCAFVGLVLVSVAGALNNGRLMAGGAVLTGLGVCGLVVCLLLCMHACFIFRVRDQAVQTEDTLWREEEEDNNDNVEKKDGNPHPHPHPQPTPIPTLSLTLPLPLPSALKTSESSTLRRQNGGEAGKKSVSYSGEVQCYSPSPLTTPSPTLSSASFFSSVFSSPPGTLDRWGREGGGGGGGGREGGGGGGGGGRGGAGGGGGGGGLNTQPFPLAPDSNHQSHSLPHNLTLRQLIEDNDYDVPVERTPMLAASSGRGPRGGGGGDFSQEVRDRGSVKSAGAEVSMPHSSSSSAQLSRHPVVTLEMPPDARTCDYDNVWRSQTRPKI